MDFAPAVYEHAARLIGRTPWEVSRDPGLLARAHAEAHRIYEHTPVVVGIDVYTVEAEAYGAVVTASGPTDIPSVTGYPAGSVREVLQLRHPDPSRAGRMPLMIEAGRAARQLLPRVDVRLPVCGPFSLLSNLIGFDTLLIEVITDPEGVSAALAHCVEGQRAYLHEIAAAGLGITMFDSGGTPPLLSPRHFREVVLPALTAMTQNIVAATGTPAACILGGDTAPIAGDLLRTNPGFLICPAETNGEEFLGVLQSRPEIRVRVNMNPSVFTQHVPEEILNEVGRVAALAGRRPNTCIGTGVVPLDTDPDLIFLARDHARSL